MVDCRSGEEVLEVSWEIILKFIKNKSCRNLEEQELLQEIAKLWLEGDSYFNIFKRLNLEKIKISNKYCRIENVVDICENGFGYDTSLLFGSIIEILKYKQEEEHTALIDRLNILQKRIKYGLPSYGSTIVYELGFSDRVIALEITQAIENDSETSLSSKTAAIRNFKISKNLYAGILDKYPSFFSTILNEVSNRVI